MELDVSAGKYPNSSVSNNVISLDVPGTLVAMVQLSNGSLVPAFTLGLVSPAGSHDTRDHGNILDHQNHGRCNADPEEWIRSDWI